jgi:nanoRNase/pAp phosphatase (c-di-AMP/oligoRNAs hydrolase)
MDKLSYKRISEFLTRSQNIGIVTPKDPNVDQMAGALSLYLSLQGMGKNLAIATPADPLVELSNLVGIDRVRTKLSYQSGDLVVSFPYKEGEIDKVSYTLDEGTLSILVKAGEQGLSFDEKDVKFIRPNAAPELLFVVGASKITDLGKLFNPADLKDTTVINIDNSPENSGFGDIVLVSTKSSSVSEIVADLILSEGLGFDQDIAQNLLWGISSSTGNFQDPKTTGLAFEMAGILMRNGAQREPYESLRTAFTGQEAELLKPQRTQPIPVQSEEQPQGEQAKNPPEDWLAPKIYKGSTNFES